MSDKSEWRKPYDSVERALAPSAEAMVRSGQFATVTAAISSVQRTVDTYVQGMASRVWHLVGLPTVSDVQRLRQQIGTLDRDVRRLSLQLGQRQEHPQGSDRR